MNEAHQADERRFYIEGVFLMLLVLLMAPADGHCQMMIGDPSLTLYNTGAAKIEIGGGKTSRMKLIFERTALNVNSVPNATFSDLPESAEEIKTEQFMVKASASLGRIGDIFGTIGQARINDPLDGDYGNLLGAGIKMSPPQNSPIKIGLILQAYRYSSEEKDFPAYVNFWGGRTADGSNASVWASGVGSEKITMTHYNAIIGFGSNSSSFVRPYAGIVYAVVDGTDEVSFSGSGNVNTTPASGGVSTSYPGTISFNAKGSIHSESSIGGFVGVTLNPAEEMGVTLEGQFGIGNSYLFSAFMRF